MDMIKKLTLLESNRLKVVRLSNQLLVGNFSSPHQFTFDDGTVLDAVSDYDSMRLKVNFIEEIIPSPIGVKRIDIEQMWTDVSLSFELSEEVYNEIDIWQKMWQHNDVDIVLCPLPMIQALKKELIIKDTPFRAVRMKDRIKKTVSCNTFTI
jgi:hypothetical protein